MRETQTMCRDGLRIREGNAFSSVCVPGHFLSAPILHGRDSEHSLENQADKVDPVEMACNRVQWPQAEDRPDRRSRGPLWWDA